MEQCTKLLGWGPWNYRHEPPRLHETELRASSCCSRCVAPPPLLAQTRADHVRPAL